MTTQEKQQLSTFNFNGNALTVMDDAPTANRTAVFPEKYSTKCVKNLNP